MATTDAPASLFPSRTLGWSWVTCFCGKHLGTQRRPVTVSAVPSDDADLALFCRSCKREVFVTVPRVPSGEVV